MRLWPPWRRSAPSSPSSPSSPSESSPVSAPDVRPAPSVRPAAGWRELPPIQRAVDEPALLSPPDRLEPALLSWRNPSFLAPLGHMVDPAGPSGYLPDAVDIGNPAPVGPADPAMPVATPAPVRSRSLQR